EGLTKLFSLFFTELDIDFQILMTSNKYDVLIDPDYCSPYAFDDYIIYIKKHDIYIYPGQNSSQINHIPSWLVGNNALVLDQNWDTQRFVEVPSQDPEKNKTFLKMAVTLHIDQNTSSIEIDAFGTGEIAHDYNDDYYYSESEEERKENIEGYLNWRIEGATIETLDIVEKEKWGDITTCEDYECKRAFSASMTASSLFDNMGDKILVNIGTIIGPQSELYSENERVLPITNSYNKSYQFEIRLTIPDGYKYAGQENVEIDNLFKNEEGEEIAGFKSILKEEKGEIIIEIYEFYNQVNIDKKYYEDFRTIINSAADFNKAIILLEKI
ncbi:MAG: hypothetical protein MK078_18040, partial [Crocinitomicaceae bacterium]|nr:hypothetical protein [Crocinitomicaceae bacterium]